MNLGSVSAATPRFTPGDGAFLLDGNPFVIKAAELHYPRIPRQYWDHRIKMCKALGMNTICLYVFWNAHEAYPDQFDFTGQNDLAAFIRLCQDNDMKVILRPGPYVCAEWEMGGLPWWLLQKDGITLRENDAYFLERVAKFEEAVADEIDGLTIDKGGPIIMIQVENEYGSYGVDKEYISNIRDIIRKNYGDEIALFQCDWSSNFLNNGLDDLIWTLNFGTGANIEEQFEPLRKARPNSPLMCSEFWSGWFDKWGASHETRSAEDMIAGLDEMLSKDISFSLYMTHGGTNWGHWAGANSPGYSPDVTSYDYDAPINEYGRPTEKYYLLRNMMANHSDRQTLPPIPDSIPTIGIKEFSMSGVATLSDNLKINAVDSVVRPMESYNQGFGSILYSTVLPANVSHNEILRIEAHDYAQVFIDDKYIGSVDRRINENEIVLPDAHKGAKLDILVEAMGRINFGRAIKDYKGIIGTPKIIKRKAETDESSGVCVLDTISTWSEWHVSLIPDDKAFYDRMTYIPCDNITKDELGRYPRGVYTGEFYVDEPGDTFLNFEQWGKGLVYVNGHPLGRIWEIGPQQTLYMPGCWLNKGRNEIMVFDIIGPKSLTVSGSETPVLDKVFDNKSECSVRPDMSEFNVIISDKFRNTGSGWQTIRFSPSSPVNTLSLDILSTVDDSNIASIAEIYLLDEHGERLSREPWKIVWCDSADIESGNYGPEKIFDLQESTYWQSKEGDAIPHTIVIDLGSTSVISGIEYLPRVDSKMGIIQEFTLSGK